MPEKKSKLAEIKTKPSALSVEEFISKNESEQKRKDSFLVLEMMKKASQEEAVLWGSSIIGFGNKRYKSEKTGREVDWFKIGFSPRKANLTLYILHGGGSYKTYLEKLGKHKVEGGCLYINKLEDIDLNVLEELIVSSLHEKK